jgi:hypothetical protein
MKRWKDNIKMDLRKIASEDERYMFLAQDCIQWRALM